MPQAIELTRCELLKRFEEKLRPLLANPDEVFNRKNRHYATIKNYIIDYLETHTKLHWVTFFLTTVFHFGVKPTSLIKVDYDKLLHRFCRDYPKANLDDAVIVLCHRGANPNYLNEQSENALFALTKNKRFWLGNNVAMNAIRIMNILFAYRLDVHHVDSERYNALWRLFERTPMKYFPLVAPALVKRGINVNYCPPNTTGNVLLKFVHFGGRLADERMVAGLIRLFVERGLDVNALMFDNNLLTMLFENELLIDQPSLHKIVQLLLDKGIDVNHKNAMGSNVLILLCFHRANTYGTLRLARLLIGRGVAVADKDDFEHNALDNLLYAIDKVNDSVLELVTLLVHSGIELTHQPSIGMEGLFILITYRLGLCMGDVLKLSRHLLSLAPPSVGCQKNSMLLCLAYRLVRIPPSWRCCSGDCDYAKRHDTISLELVKLFLDHGSDPNAQTIFEPNMPPMSCLPMFCRYYKGANLDQLTELLLQNGADPNWQFRSKNGKLRGLIDMLLRNPAQTSKEKTLKILLENGYCVYRRTNRNVCSNFAVQQLGFANTSDYLKLQGYYSAHKSLKFKCNPRQKREELGMVSHRRVGP